MWPLSAWVRDWGRGAGALPEGERSVGKAGAGRRKGQAVASQHLEIITSAL